MRLKIFRRDLPLKHVMTVFRGTISRIRAINVELEQDGLKGFGEAYEDPHYGVSIEDMSLELEKCKSLVADYALADSVAFAKMISGVIKNNTPALAAIEMAACDLWGKLHDLPLWRIWRYDNQRPLPLSSYTLGLDSLYRILEKFSEQPDWPIYRVKLGSHDDMEILRELRKRTDAPFRLDVNGCWSCQKALEYLDELTTLNIELIEQPLHPDDVEGMKKFKKVCPIPLIADESCQTFEDIEKCVEFFDGVNLKPIKFGGLNPTRRAIAMAQKLNLKTMVGNTIESTIGASATAQFAYKVDYVYLDGPLLIDVDNIKETGVVVDRGVITLPHEGGTGVRLTRTS